MRHRCLLAANTKDERNWVEWTRFHLAQGWTHLLLFDDFSSDAMRPSAIDPRMTVRREHHRKTKYMNLALTFARERNFDYLLYIDMDEYVILRRHDDLNTFLASLTQDDDAPSPDVIHFHWLFFGSAFLDHIPAFRPTSLMTHYTQSARALDHRIKSMVRPSRVHVSRDPHTYFFPPDATDPLVVTANGLRSCVLQSAHYPVADVPARESVHAYLAHYAHQCWTEFCRRRSRPRDDTGCVRQFPYALKGFRGPCRFHHCRENAVRNEEPRQIMERFMREEKIMMRDDVKANPSHAATTTAAGIPCRHHRLDAAIVLATASTGSHGVTDAPSTRIGSAAHVCVSPTSAGTDAAIDADAADAVFPTTVSCIAAIATTANEHAAVSADNNARHDATPTAGAHNE